MTTYKVSTYEDKATYTVEMDETGVVSVDGLSDSATELLQYSVKRHMDNLRLSPAKALGKSVGPYSFVTEVTAEVEVP